MPTSYIDVNYVRKKENAVYKHFFRTSFSPGLFEGFNFVTFAFLAFKIFKLALLFP